MAQVGANWPGLLVIVVDWAQALQGAVRLACGPWILRQTPVGTPVSENYSVISITYVKLQHSAVLYRNNEYEHYKFFFHLPHYPSLPLITSFFWGEKGKHFPFYGGRKKVIF
ncbi:MAG: hypothetical protein ACP59X_03430 [Solidesulfovibrio sp. DCME]|uniref:hypothetical protein n=1 Tax=Solidesulfovibrio sp. DCME TaxID=3447380 RepID=UPI003D0AD58D